MRKSAIVGEHPELLRLQAFTFDVVPPEMNGMGWVALNPVPSCAMIEEERTIREGRSHISRPFALLSTWGSGLCLFHKNETNPLENKLKLVSTRFITDLNEVYETDDFKLASSDTHFFVAGERTIWEMDVNGDLSWVYEPIIPNIQDDVGSTPLSMVCDNQWVACSHKVEVDDGVDTLEYGVITLMECDDRRRINHSIVLTPLISTSHGSDIDDSYLNPIMLSPMCFMAGPSNARKMYYIEEYKLYDAMENETVEWRVANFDETTDEEFEVVKEYKTRARPDVEYARARASDQCASMFPSHFRDFQRLNRISPFFYPHHVMDPGFGGLRDDAMKTKSDVDPLIAPVFYDASLQGHNVHRCATEVALNAYQRAFVIAADGATHEQLEEYFERAMPDARLMQRHHAQNFLNSMAMMYLLEDRMPTRLASWEVCALLTDENHLQIRSMIEMTENDMTHELTCDSRLSDYKLSDDPVALCGTSQDKQFCLCSAGQSGFLFERFAWGANPMMVRSIPFDIMRPMRPAAAPLAAAAAAHLAAAAAAAPLAAAPLAAAAAAAPLSPRSLRAARMGFFGNSGGNQGGSRKTIKRNKKHKRTKSRRTKTRRNHYNN